MTASSRSWMRRLYMNDFAGEVWMMGMRFPSRLAAGDIDPAAAIADADLRDESPMTDTVIHSI